MRTWSTIMLLLTAALAGCAGDPGTEPGTDAASDAGDGQNQTADPTGPAGNSTVPSANNTAPTANLTVDLLNGTAPLLVNFTLNGTDADGDNLTWILTVFAANGNATQPANGTGNGTGAANGTGNATQVANGTQIANGTSLPATFSYNFTEAGNFTVALVVSDGHADAEASLDITVGQAAAEPVLHELSCTVDVGLGNPVVGVSDGEGLGGCHLGTLPSPGVYLSGDIPSGCSVSYDADGDGLGDGDVGDTEPHPTSHDFSAFCELGVRGADVSVTFELEA